MQPQLSLFQRATAGLCLLSLIIGQFPAAIFAQQPIASSFTEDPDGAKGIQLNTELGELYSLEVASQLTDWAPVKEWYGLGLQVDQKLFAKAAAPTPALGDPGFTAPAASIMVQPGASGTGVVVSWRSLDDGKGRQVFSPTSSLHANWPTTIVKNGSGFRFLIRKNPQPAPFNPPPSSPATANDAAMFNAFTGSLPTFNAAIASGNVQSDPAPAPPKVSEIGTKQFYRIKRSNSPDTDQDGMLDKQEFSLYGTNPFTRNSDGDSADDGDELAQGLNPINATDSQDSDNDKIPDYKDVHPTDPLLDWERVPDTLYSWSQFTYPSDARGILGIGDDDTIYFQAGVLRPNGAWTKLALQTPRTPSPEIYEALATGFNQNGQIVGMATAYWSSIFFTTYTGAVCWPTPTSLPQLIGRGDSLLYTYYGKPTITDDGSIQLMGLPGNPPGRNYTTVNTASLSGTNPFSYSYFSAGIASEVGKHAYLNPQFGVGMRYHQNADMTYYHDLVCFKNGSTSLIASRYPNGATIGDIETLPNGRAGVAGRLTAPANGCFFEKADGTWAQSPNVINGININKRGEILSGSTTIWRNGQAVSLISLCPQLQALGYFNASGYGFNNSGNVLVSAYNITSQGQPSKPTIYGIMRPGEGGIDVISRDELTGVFRQKGGLIEQARAMPAVNLNVTATRILSSGNAEIDVSCSVRDALSELTASPGLRLQDLKIYIDGTLVETINNLPGLAPANTVVPIWQPYPSQYTFQRTYTIPNVRAGTVNLRAETGLNPAGNQGWDIASVLFTRAGTDDPEVSSNANFALRFGSALGSGIDTVFGRFGTGIEAPLTESAGNSFLFTGTVNQGGTPQTVFLRLDPGIFFSASADQVRGSIQIGSLTSSETLLRWQETANSSLVFNPAAQITTEVNGTTPAPALRVASVKKGTRSIEGSVNPFVVRLAVKTGTLAQIGSTFRLEVGGTTYPVIASSTLIPGQSPPSGTEWLYAAENGSPKVFAASPYQSGTLIPAETFARGSFNAVLWNNTTSRPAATGAWAISEEPSTLPFSNPTVPSTPPALAAASPQAFAMAAAAAGNYTQEEVLLFYDLIFGEYGKILKEALESRGLIIKVTNIYDLDGRDWARQNFSARAKQQGLVPELWVDNELDNVTDAAVALYEGLYSFKKWYIRDDLRIALLEDVLNEAVIADPDYELIYKELNDANLVAIADSLEAFALAAEIGLTIVNEPLDYVLSFSEAGDHLKKGEVVQAGTTATLAVLPFICGRLSKAGKAIEVELPDLSFTIGNDAQKILAKTIVKDITRVERMNILGPAIADGTISEELVDALYKGGFLKHNKTAPSAILQANLEAALGVAKKWGEVAHHDLPTKYDIRFLKAGIDINHGADTGRFLTKEFHSKLHNGPQWGGVKGSPWNYQWERFFADNLNATPDDILVFRDALRLLTSNPKVDVSKINWPYKP